MREHSTPSLTIHACDYCHALRRQEELAEVVREASPGWQCRDAAACRERREERRAAVDAAWWAADLGGECGGA